jgi:hypothetical protein
MLYIDTEEKIMKNSIEFRGDDLQNESVMREVLSDLSSQLAMPIIVRNHHGSRRGDRKIKEDAINIFFWSTPSMAEKTAFLFKVFGSGLNRGGSTDAFKPSNKPENIPIFCPEGFVVAEVPYDNQNCLYILFDLPHDRPDNVEKNLKGIIDIYFREVLLRPSEILKTLLSVSILICRAEQAVAESDKKKISDAFKKIGKEAQVEIGMETITIMPEPGKKIMFETADGYYKVIDGGKPIPFHMICPGPAKTGLSVCMGKHQYYEAYKIIANWLKIHSNQAGR